MSSLGGAETTQEQNNFSQMLAGIVGEFLHGQLATSLTGSSGGPKHGGGDTRTALQQSPTLMWCSSNADLGHFDGKDQDSQGSVRETVNN